MMGKTHTAVSVAVYCTYDLPKTFEEVGSWLIGLSVVLVTSLLPDIDEPRSRIGKFLMPLVPAGLRPVMFCIIGAILVFLHVVLGTSILLVGLGVLLIACSLVKHRENPTHALVGLVLVSACIVNLRPELLIPAVIGYGLHLVLDILTEGIPLFWPSKVWIKVQITETGSRLEKLVFYRGAQVWTIWMLIQDYCSGLLM